eukprot:TRINITY_DN27285_c0_g1_i1.p1 TRINITY_DN27285_c0_g1~~TRINITY_DN27285_c0_g1_i1.p1  ORF type:complete len:247 (+),score=94.72 TRINITY_DN27285_c0_g1_i1:85-825(+)
MPRGEPEVVLYDREQSDLCGALRLLLHATETPFSDVGCDNSTAEAMQQEGRLPFGDLPVLWTRERLGNGFSLAPADAAVRCLARTHGLEGDSLRDQRLCDVAASAAFALASDLRGARAAAAAAGAAHAAAAQAVRVRAQQQLSLQQFALPPPADLVAEFLDTAPARLEPFERLLREHSPEGPFFCGKGLQWTYADIVVFDTCELLLLAAPGCTADLPRLQQHHRAVASMQCLRGHVRAPAGRLPAP